MPVWTDEDLEAAFYTWAKEAKKDMARTSEITGIPERTLYYHKKTRDWERKYRTEVLGMAGDAAAVAKAEFTLLFGAAVSRLSKMLEDDKASHQDQRENIKLLRDLVFGSEPDEKERPLTLIDARSIVAQVKDQNPLNRAMEAIEANIAEANDQSRLKKRKTF